MLLTVFSARCIYPTYLGRRRIPHEIWALVVFAIIYVGGSSLLSAYHRFLLPVIPMLILWIIFALYRLTRIDVLR